VPKVFRHHHVWSRIKGLFGSQPQFAKLNFGSHKLFGLCLIFATLVVCHTSLIIWLTCHRVNFLANSCPNLTSNFLATLFVAVTLLWLATLWLDKIWLGIKHPLSQYGAIPGAEVQLLGASLFGAELLATFFFTISFSFLGSWKEQRYSKIWSP
jgi:hypothetical protein